MRIVLSGTIGVGKSTILKMLQQRTFFRIQEEYINQPGGQIAFDSWLSGALSGFEFQKYIIDCYQQYYVPGNVIQERCSSDNIIFSDILLKNGELTQEQYDYILNRIEPIRWTNIIKVSNMGSPEQTCNEIMNQIKLSDKNVLIVIVPDFEITLKRIRTRNRPGEGKYTREYLKDLYNRYLLFADL